MIRLLLLLFISSIIYGQKYCQYDDSKLERDWKTPPRTTSNLRKEYKYVCTALSAKKHYYWIVDQSSDPLKQYDTKDPWLEALDIIVNEWDKAEEKKKYKKCPYCAEEIKKEAVKCRHCGEFVNKKSVQSNKPNDNSDGYRSIDSLRVKDAFSVVLPAKSDGVLYKNISSSSGLKYKKGNMLEVYNIIRGSYIFVNGYGVYGYIYKINVDVPDAFLVQ